MSSEIRKPLTLSDIRTGSSRCSNSDANCDSARVITLFHRYSGGIPVYSEKPWWTPRAEPTERSSASAS